MPITRHPPHIKFIPIVNVENNTKNGPGHKPPIPHPKPNIKAPNTSLKSISLTCGLNNVSPKRGFPGFLISNYREN